MTPSSSQDAIVHPEVAKARAKIAKRVSTMFLPTIAEPGVPTDYPTEIPALDAPPQAAFQHCGCGVLVLTRRWHNRTATVPAHWELYDPPVTPVCGGPHVCNPFTQGAPHGEESVS